MSAEALRLEVGAAAESEPMRSRRAILAAAAGAAGAALATLARPLQVDAGEGDPIRIGRANKGAGTNTTLTTKTGSGGALKIVQNGGGIAVLGQGSSGVGIRGTSLDNTGVSGQSENWVGVGGISENLFGVWAQSTNSYAGFFVNEVFLGGFVDLAEVSTPAAPAAGTARLFVRDDGGKTTLSVILPDGTMVDLAAEA